MLEIWLVQEDSFKPTLPTNNLNAVEIQLEREDSFKPTLLTNNLNAVGIQLEREDLFKPTLLTNLSISNILNCCPSPNQPIIISRRNFSPTHITKLIQRHQRSIFEIPNFGFQTGY
jgi:hypothetical protein